MPAFAAPVIAGIATGAGAAIAGAATGAAIALGAITAGLQLVSTLLTKKPRHRSPTYDGDRIETTSTPARVIPVAFGSVAVGGNYINATEPGGTEREVVLALGAGEWNAVLQVRVSDRPFGTLLRRGSNEPTYTFLSGAVDQAVPSSEDFPLLHETFTNLPAYRNIATLWVKYVRRDQTAAGLRYEVYSEGVKCWDTSFASREFSRNPARVAMTLLTEFLRVPQADVDTTAFAELESYCDAYGDETDSFSENLMGPGAMAASSVRITNDNPPYTHSPYYVLLPGNNKYNKWGSDADPATTPQWISYDFGEQSAVRVARFLVRTSSTSNVLYPSEFNFQGSHDGSTWTDLNFRAVDSGDSFSTNYNTSSWDAATDRTFELQDADIDRYRHYRIYITDSNGQYVDIAVWRMFAKLGGITPRYRFDYVYDTSQSVADALKVLSGSFHGRIEKRNGLWKPMWFHAQDSVFDFTKSNIVRNTIQAGTDESPNVIRVFYRNRTRAFRQDVAEVRFNADIDRRGEVVFEEQADYITDRETALRRVQFQANYKRRLPNWCEFQSTLEATPLEWYDVVTVTHPMITPESKQYFVESIKYDSYGRPTFRLREYDDSIFTTGTSGSGTNGIGAIAYDQSAQAAALSSSISATAVGGSLAAATATLVRETQQSEYWFAGNNTDGQVITVPDDFMESSARLVINGQEWPRKTPASETANTWWWEVTASNEITLRYKTNAPNCVLFYDID